MLRIPRASFWTRRLFSTAASADTKDASSRLSGALERLQTIGSNGGNSQLSLLKEESLTFAEFEGAYLQLLANKKSDPLHLIQLMNMYNISSRNSNQKPLVRAALEKLDRDLAKATNTSVISQALTNIHVVSVDISKNFNNKLVNSFHEKLTSLVPTHLVVEDLKMLNSLLYSFKFALRRETKATMEYVVKMSLPFDELFSVLNALKRMHFSSARGDRVLLNNFVDAINSAILSKNASDLCNCRFETGSIYHILKGTGLHWSQLSTAAKDRLKESIAMSSVATPSIWAMDLVAFHQIGGRLHEFSMETQERIIQQLLENIKQIKTSMKSCNELDTNLEAYKHVRKSVSRSVKLTSLEEQAEAAMETYFQSDKELRNPKKIVSTMVGTNMTTEKHLNGLAMILESTLNKITDEQDRTFVFLEYLKTIPSLNIKWEYLPSKLQSVLQQEYDNFFDRYASSMSDQTHLTQDHQDQQDHQDPKSKSINRFELFQKHLELASITMSDMNQFNANTRVNILKGLDVSFAMGHDVHGLVAATYYLARLNVQVEHLSNHLQRNLYNLAYTVMSQDYSDEVYRDMLYSLDYMGLKLQSNKYRQAFLHRNEKVLNTILMRRKYDDNEYNKFMELNHTHGGLHHAYMETPFYRDSRLLAGILLNQEHFNCSLDDCSPRYRLKMMNTLDKIVPFTHISSLHLIVAALKKGGYVFDKLPKSLQDKILHKLSHSDNIFEHQFGQQYAACLDSARQLGIQRNTFSNEQINCIQDTVIRIVKRSLRRKDLQKSYDFYDGTMDPKSMGEMIVALRKLGISPFSNDINLEPSTASPLTSSNNAVDRSIVESISKALDLMEVDKSQPESALVLLESYGSCQHGYGPLPEVSSSRANYAFETLLSSHQAPNIFPRLISASSVLQSDLMENAIWKSINNNNSNKFEKIQSQVRLLSQGFVNYLNDDQENLDAKLARASTLSFSLNQWCMNNNTTNNDKSPLQKSRKDANCPVNVDNIVNSLIRLLPKVTNLNQFDMCTKSICVLGGNIDALDSTSRQVMVESLGRHLDFDATNLSSNVSTIMNIMYNLSSMRFEFQHLPKNVQKQLITHFVTISEKIIKDGALVQKLKGEAFFHGIKSSSDEQSTRPVIFKELAHFAKVNFESESNLLKHTIYKWMKLMIILDSIKCPTSEIDAVMSNLKGRSHRDRSKLLSIQSILNKENNNDAFVNLLRDAYKVAIEEGFTLDGNTNVREVSESKTRSTLTKDVSAKFSREEFNAAMNELGGFLRSTDWMRTLKQAN